MIILRLTRKCCLAVNGRHSHLSFPADCVGVCQLQLLLSTGLIRVSVHISLSLRRLPPRSTVRSRFAQFADSDVLKNNYDSRCRWVICLAEINSLTLIGLAFLLGLSFLIGFSFLLLLLPFDLSVVIYESVVRQTLSEPKGEHTQENIEKKPISTAQPDFTNPIKDPPFFGAIPITNRLSS